LLIAVIWPFTWHWECIVSTELSQVGLSLAVITRVQWYSPLERLIPTPITLSVVKVHLPCSTCESPASDDVLCNIHVSSVGSLLIYEYLEYFRHTHLMWMKT